MMFNFGTFALGIPSLAPPVLTAIPIALLSVRLLSAPDGAGAGQVPALLESLRGQHSGGELAAGSNGLGYSLAAQKRTEDQDVSLAPTGR